MPDRQNDKRDQVRMTAVDKDGVRHEKTVPAGGDGTHEIHYGSKPGVHQASGDQTIIECD